MDELTELLANVVPKKRSKGELLSEGDWSTKQVVEAKARRDPDELVRLFAWDATYQQGDEQWPRWVRAVELLGRDPFVELRLLSDRELDALGFWATQRRALVELGLAAYARFLDKPVFCLPHHGHNVEYLLTLIDVGRSAEVEGEVSRMRALAGRVPEEDVVLASVKARAGDAAAKKKLASIARDIDKPAGHRTMSAFLLHGFDPRREWAEIIADVIARQSFWLVWRARFRKVPDAYGIVTPDRSRSEDSPRGHTEGSPKYVVEPGKSAAIAHGERGFTTPACRGCGHAVHVWFAIAPAEVPELAKWLPWRRAPLLSCADCGFWMGVHRYAFDPGAQSLELLETELDGDVACATVHATAEAPTPQGAKLVKVTPGAWRKLFDKREPTVVAGKPPRLHEHTWPRCRACRRWMRYYAALGQSDGFDGQPALLNDAGFLLHFACVPCGRLTVVPNWT